MGALLLLDRLERGAGVNMPVVADLVMLLLWIPSRRVFAAQHTR